MLIRPGPICHATNAGEVASPLLSNVPQDEGQIRAVGNRLSAAPVALPKTNTVSQFPLQSPQAKHPARLLVRFGRDTQRACDQYAMNPEEYSFIGHAIDVEDMEENYQDKAMSDQSDRDP